MRARRSEAGFTLIELLVVAAIVAAIALTAGTFFLAGASPAVASAGRDVTAAFVEARRTALAFDAATVVFVPRPSGGYRARVYARFPGDAGFAPRNGPAYESTVTIGEVAAPLGPPGFAFAIDSRGAVTGYANFQPGASTFAGQGCPAGGAFVLRLSYVTQVRTVTVPCAAALSSANPLAPETPAAYAPAPPSPAPTCPGACALAPLQPGPLAACPAGDAPDPAVPGLCDPAPATPPGGGTGPAASPVALPQPPGGDPAPAGCSPGAPDALGFASCLESNPVAATGPAITRQSCGTHTPVDDPGPAFTVTVDVFQDGELWGRYAVALVTTKAPWLDVAEIPPEANCGLLYTLSFSIASVTALDGNARISPPADTGDPDLAGEGVGAIVTAPLGAAWGSDA
jgi:prepilin-type N-terminal cleavage/methylation domain-containing protein